MENRAELNIPKEFLHNMEAILGDEYGDFLSSYEKTRATGLRINPLKYNEEALLKTFKRLKNVPWEETGFYYESDIRPGKHPLHEAGAYYIQEPSAMSAAAVLDVRPGDLVLDLCAAPGGKSTQIAGKLAGTGLLVSNEINHERARILSSNIERMGIRNAVVLNETSERLKDKFPVFFDKILVDAPCSGEGMFKKEDEASKQWSVENVKMCAERQKEILKNAAEMLKSNGYLCYSTCTFNQYENESVINDFLKENPDFKIVSSDKKKFFSEGRPGLIKGADPSLKDAMRLWPHKLNGEGHFVCLLKKEGSESAHETFEKNDRENNKEKENLKTFLINECNIKRETADLILSGGTVASFGDNIYIVPKPLRTLSALKTERPGLHIAVNKKNRLEPAHALFMSLRPFEAEACAELNDTEVNKFILGETVTVPTTLRGFVPVFYSGVSIGFGKAVNGTLKNHYPKGLRKDLTQSV